MHALAVLRVLAEDDADDFRLVLVDFEMPWYYVKISDYINMRNLINCY